MTDPRQLKPLVMGDRLFHWGDRTYIMGILNVTPDSFSDGGQFNAPDRAMAQVAEMVAAGVDIIDVGGQSTRPGAVEISLGEECDRTIPIIEQIRAQYPTPISIDTTRAVVAEAAVAAGANLVNDISGGTFDPEMFSTVARLEVPYVLMHIRGTPATMQTLTDYQDLIGEISTFFQTQIDLAVHAGVRRSHLILDPGIGFAKTAPQNIELLRRLREFDPLGCPLLIGPSRKSFIGHILNQPDPQLRIWGTAGAAGGAIASRCDILRVHDVGPMVEVCRVADQILRSTPQTP